jgi:stage III sporulation protein SpoIIIAA
VGRQYSILDRYAGKAIIICGPEGCGKTLLTRMITEQYQTVFCGMRQIAGKFNGILAGSPEVLVIDEFLKEDDLNVIRKLVVNGTCELELQGRDQRTVKTPKHIIVCSTLPPEHFQSHRADQRWFVTLSIQGGV